MGEIIWRLERQACHMLFIGGMILFVALITVVCVYSGVNWKDSIGQNMGRKHLKEDWGIEEKED